MDNGKIIRFARLPIAVDLSAMQRDVAALPDRWTLHFQTLHYDGEWCVLPLRSIEGAVDPTVPSALDARDADATRYRATPLCAECPAIARFLDSLQCPVMSARLLSLRRGAIIKPTAEQPLVVPEGAVVVPGARAVTGGKGPEWGLSVATPVIVKYRDSRTDTRTELEAWIR